MITEAQIKAVEKLLVILDVTLTQFVEAVDSQPLSFNAGLAVRNMGMAPDGFLDRRSWRTWASKLTR